MTISNAELRNRTAQYLRIKAADRDLDDADASFIDSQITDLLAELTDRGLNWWSAGSIPEEAVFPLTQIAASRCCTPFGKAGQGYEAGYQMGLDALQRIFPTVAVEATSTVTTVQLRNRVLEYLRVLASDTNSPIVDKAIREANLAFAELGLSVGSENATPVEYVEAMVWAVAERVAPAFEKEGYGGGFDRAVSLLERLVSSDPVDTDATILNSKLATRILEFLGQRASDRNTPRAQKALRDVYFELTAQGLATWSDDATPMRASHAMVLAGAHRAAPAFGVTPPEIWRTRAEEILRGVFANVAVEATSTLTTAQLRARVLEFVRVQASDTNTPIVDKAIREAVNSFAEIGLSVGAENATPIELAQPVVWAVAERVAPAFNRAGYDGGFAKALDALEQLVASSANDSGSTVSNANLVIRVLEFLGQRSSDRNTPRAQKALRDVYNELYGSGLATWADDATPSKAAHGVVLATAHRLSTAFGIAPNQAWRAQAELLLRRVYATAAVESGSTLTTTNIRNRVSEHLMVPVSDTVTPKIDKAINDAQAMLREQGVSWWPSSAIPLVAARGLTLVVSGLVGPSLERPTASADYEAGMMMLRGLKPSADIEEMRVLYY